MRTFLPLAQPEPNYLTTTTATTTTAATTTIATCNELQQPIITDQSQPQLTITNDIPPQPTNGPQPTITSQQSVLAPSNITINDHNGTIH